MAETEELPLTSRYAQAQRVGNVGNAFDGFAHDVFGQLLFHMNLFLISFAFYI